MKPRVYLETSVVSYVTSPFSRDLIVAGHQQITAEWWAKHRKHFDVVVSDFVARECGRGDPDLAASRLALIAGYPTLELEEPIEQLAVALVEGGPLPRKAAGDALHIAFACSAGAAYLLTWNCKHIANAAMRPSIERICGAAGYTPPILCTPEQLMGPYVGRPDR
jgi:hypothetical protein